MEKIFYLILVAALTVCAVGSDGSCSPGDEIDTRYILYDINPGEGFNLRRDVYMRVANLAKTLNEQELWTVVLPPWGNLYHWKKTQRDHFYPWGIFFDLKSLHGWTKVIEFSDYMKVIETSSIGQAFLLQQFKEGWGGKWEEKYEIRPCNEPHLYKSSGESWQVEKWNKRLKFKNFTCISFQGQASTAIPLLREHPESSSILLDRAETLLHDSYGDAAYWGVRRSMRFSKNLINKADDFIKLNFDMSKESVGVDTETNWRDFKPKRGLAKGFPFVSVHLRRKDFVRARPTEVPSIKYAAEQLKKLIKSQNVSSLFVASDAPLKEIDQLKELLPGVKVLQYSGSETFIDIYGEGGLAVIDQILCSYARYFIGTFESTFSFRIQEEREILGFKAETTFNRLCGSDPQCDQPSQWLIQY